MLSDRVCPRTTRVTGLIRQRRGGGGIPTSQGQISDEISLFVLETFLVLFPLPRENKLMKRGAVCSGQTAEVVLLLLSVGSGPRGGLPDGGSDACRCVSPPFLPRPSFPAWSCPSRGPPPARPPPGRRTPGCCTLPSLASPMASRQTSSRLVLHGSSLIGACTGQGSR